MWEQLSSNGRAFRGQRLVCSQVTVTVFCDSVRARATPRRVRVRFHSGIEANLRDELTRLILTRGYRAKRLAEGLEPIEVQWDEPKAGVQSSFGRLEPPTRTGLGELTSIDFPLRPITERDL